jgi:hypothetical protein
MGEVGFPSKTIHQGPGKRPTFPRRIWPASVGTSLRCCKTVASLPAAGNVAKVIDVAFNPVNRLNPQFGYWLGNDSKGIVTSMAGMLEVNVNSMVDAGELENVVNLGPSVVCNIKKTEVAAGMLVPVASDEAYKWELAFRVNRLF